MIGLYLDEMFQSLLPDIVYFFFLIESKLWPILGIVTFFSVYLSYVIKKKFIVIIFLLALALSYIPLPMLHAVSGASSQKYLGYEYVVPNKHLYVYLTELIILSLIFYRVDRYSYVARRIRRVFGLDDCYKISRYKDIRTIRKYLPKPIKFNPINYINVKNGILFGLDENYFPVYLSVDDWLGSHVDISGHTGCGKGVLMAILSVQALMRGESAVIIDPKGDEFLPHILSYYAKKYGKKLNYIDLEGDVAQWHPFYDKTFKEIIELLSSILKLGDKNTDGDFYRGLCRRLSRGLADLYKNSSDSLLGLYEKLSESVDDPDNNKLLIDLDELLSSKSCHARKGINIAEALNEGQIIYVKGSVDDPGASALQKMFLMSVLQHAKTRNLDESPHICLCLDEFKYSASPPALNGLSLLRGSHVHAVLAYQSMLDLRNCDDVSYEEISANLNTNCDFRVIYKQNDPDLADWYARKSGYITDYAEVITKSNSKLGGKEGRLTLQESSRPLLNSNVLMSLPPKCAVLYGNGLPKFILTSYIPIEKSPENLQPTIYEDDPGDYEPFGGGLIDVD